MTTTKRRRPTPENQSDPAAYRVEYRYAWQSQSVYRVVGAMCSDGVRRTATVTGEPNTWFSTPARVQVRHRSVSGFLSACHDSCPREASDGLEAAELLFTAYAYGKNGHLLPGIPTLSHNGWGHPQEGRV